MSSEPKTQLPELDEAFEKIVAIENTIKLEEPKSPSQRRRFIGGLAASTAAIIGGCSREPISKSDFQNLLSRLESAGTDAIAQLREELERKPAPPAKSRNLPGEKEYTTFLAGLNLKHISPHEVIQPHRNIRSGIANSLPPREIWSRMTPTLHVADKIRSRLGVRLDYINSAYRSPAYNAACPGAASRSYHMKNCALDLMFDCDSENAFTMAKKLRSEGAFKGGIGLYETFIHIDTRGYNSTWGGT